MEEIIQLMHEKNHYLEKFFDLNKSEIARISIGNFENIQSFYHNRDTLLELVQYVDTKIAALNEATQVLSKMDGRDRDRVLTCLDRKDELAMEIIDQDLIIMGHIENAKSELLREIGSVAKARKAVRGYRSDSAGT